MKTEFKPTGYTSVSPYFIVNGAQRLIDLMKHIFNATELRRFDRPDGTIMHAEVRIDDSVIMIGDSSDEFPPLPWVIHVYVPRVDETFQKLWNMDVKLWKSQGRGKVIPTGAELLKTLPEICGLLVLSWIIQKFRSDKS